VFIDRLKFASIADEKVIRVFEAPRSFVEVLEHLKVSNFSDEEVRLQIRTKTEARLITFLFFIAYPSGGGQRSGSGSLKQSGWRRYGDHFQRAPVFL
jgi:hypothetical protein